jgi:DNA polymerase III epsilon subunit-like protein
MRKPIIYCAADIETTGLSALRDEIIEVAVIRFVDGEPVDRYQSLVRSRIPVPGKATELHGLRDADLRDAPGIAEVLRRFVDFVGELPTVFHHAPFDVSFLERDVLAAVLWCDVPAFDTCAMAKRASLGLSRFDLDNVANALNVPATDRHRALGDAETTGRVFWGLFSARANTTAGALARSAATRPRLHPLTFDGVRKATKLERFLRLALPGAEVSLTAVYRGTPTRQTITVDFWARENEWAYLVGRPRGSAKRRSYRVDAIAGIQPISQEAQAPDTKLPLWPDQDT